MQVKYHTALLAKEKGFKANTSEIYNDNKVLIINSNYPGYIHEFDIAAPTQSELQKWLREQCDIHIQIRKENYVYKNYHCEYFHYDISKGQADDITNQEELYATIMEKCFQDIPGNHLDSNKLSTLMFEKEFAFNTYEETLEKCLQQALNMI